jgi:hypothetical protein
MTTYPELPTMEQGREAHDRHRASEGDDVVTHDIDQYDWGIACQDCSWAIVCREDFDDDSDMLEGQP